MSNRANIFQIYSYLRWNEGGWQSSYSTGSARRHWWSSRSRTVWNGWSRSPSCRRLWRRSTLSCGWHNLWRGSTSRAPRRRRRYSSESFNNIFMLTPTCKKKHNKETAMKQIKNENHYLFSNTNLQKKSIGKVKYGEGERETVKIWPALMCST